mgnify:CR=1 FL=1
MVKADGALAGEGWRLGNQSLRDTSPGSPYTYARIHICAYPHMRVSTYAYPHMRVRTSRCRRVGEAALPRVTSLRSWSRSGVLVSRSGEPAVEAFGLLRPEAVGSGESPPARGELRTLFGRRPGHGAEKGGAFLMADALERTEEEVRARGGEGTDRDSVSARASSLSES